MSKRKQTPTRQEVPTLATLQARPQWVCWRREQRNGKTTKLPYTPQSGRLASSNQPATWSTYTIAREAYQRSLQTERPYDGIGYMFHRDVTGIDLDHCIAPDGTIDDWAQRYLDLVKSYSETSPGGDGIHILALGTVPKGIKRGLPGKRHPKAAIEVYCEGRYFTITGKLLPECPATLEQRQEALHTLYAELTGGPVNTPAAIPAAHTAPLTLEDEQLLRKAAIASNGEKFRALFERGDQSGYPSASEADFALCMMLAFWTGKDLEQMDRMYRRSALYREKWETARSESTYGWETLHKAAARCRVVYNPQRTRNQLERDIAQLLQQIARQQGTRRETKHTSYELQPRPCPTATVLRYLEMNEYGDALFFADVFAGQVCYDHSGGKWYLWNGHHWQEDRISKVRQLVAGVLGNLYLKTAADLHTTSADLRLKLQALQEQGSAAAPAEQDALSQAYKALTGQIDALQARAKALRSAKRNTNVLLFIQSEMGITSDRWDTHPWLLGVPNGVIDLRTGECRPGVPEEYIRTISPTEWTGLETPCPRFVQFLQEIFAEKENGEEVIAFLHRLLGYSITGVTTLHIFPILYGPEGRNGKDTLLATLSTVLGPLVSAVSNDVFLSQEKMRAAGAASPHLVDLQGKRLAWGSETKEGDRLNIAQIKQLTGGGDISTRQLHGHQYTFTPTHKLLLMTNYKPHAEARDKAFWSRACLLEFGLRFVEDPQAPNERRADLTLKETLQQECSGILAWLVRGCLAWQQQGLNIPASVQLATDNYRNEEDRLLLFLQECCIVKPEAAVKAGALFQAYRAWYDDNQFGGRGMNGKLFGDEMSKRFVKKATKNGRIYQGVGLLSPDPGDEQPSLFEEEVKGGEESAHTVHASSEDGLQELVTKKGEGCEGLRHVFLYNEQKDPPIGGKHGNTLHTLHPSSPVTINNPASEANGRQQEAKSETLHHPSPTNMGRACKTMWEEDHKGAHQATATHMSGLYWWCDRCQPQETLIALGEQLEFPECPLPGGTKRLEAGRMSWVFFAQEAGYLRVQQLVDLIQRERGGTDAEA